MPRKIRDLISGELFGKLTVISKIENTRDKTYLCECTCGNKKQIKATYLLRDITKSCGKSSCRNKVITHGKSNTKLYMVWCGIKNRINNPTGANKCYEGITLCEEWHDFQVFYDWSMDNGYTEGMSIDRIEGHLGYSPNNCRWTDKVVQAQNRKGWANAEVKYKGVCKSKPRAGKKLYQKTGNKPYYWRFQYKGEKHEAHGFETAELAYEGKCNYIEKHFNGLVYP